MSWYKKGFKAAEEEEQRLAEKRKKSGFYEIRIRDGEMRVFRLLHPEPIQFNRHKVVKWVKGEEKFEYVTCSGKNCRHCRDGNKSMFATAWLIIDYTNPVWDKEKKRFKKDSDGNVLEQTKIGLWIRGSKCMHIIKKRNAKADGKLHLHTLEVERTGNDTNTVYDYTLNEREDLSKDDIKMLDERGIPYKDPEAVMELLAEILAPNEEGGDDEEQDDAPRKGRNNYRPDDEEEAPRSRTRRTTRSRDEDEDEEDTSSRRRTRAKSDDDEEEDEQPARGKVRTRTKVAPASTTRKRRATVSAEVDYGD